MKMREIRRVRIKITGMVQGVFYRVETRREAQRLGLNGYVRNMSDTSVEAIAEGPPAQIDALIKWCRTGPPLARVDKVSVKEETSSGAESGFNVSY